MLQPKKGFENTDVSYRLGTTRININTNNITQDHIDVAKRYGIDLTMYVEDVESKLPVYEIVIDENSGVESINFVEAETEEMMFVTFNSEDIQEPIKPKANAKAKTNKRPKRTN